MTELIGRGNDRDCWRHPRDGSLCIKIARPGHQRPQNEIDYHYSRFLEKQRIRSRHLPRVYGWVRTNRGRGLVCDLIHEPDGKPSPELLDAVRGGSLSREQVIRLIDEARRSLG